MTLLEEIRAKCPKALIDAREHGQIAALVSEGRTRPSGLLVGKGTVLQTIGMTAGNAFLDVIDNTPDFRHVKGMVADGSLDISLPLVTGTIASFVTAGVLTQAQANELLALSTVPAPVSVQEVVTAMEGL